MAVMQRRVFGCARAQPQAPCAYFSVCPTFKAGMQRRPPVAASAVVQEATGQTAQSPVLGRRTSLQGLLALLATSAACISWPSQAAGGPRQLSPEQAAAISKAFTKVINKAKAPVVLRLAYHDAGTFSKAAGDGGLNASIQFELSRPENFGLKRGWGVLQQVMDQLKGTPAQGAVSYADLIALAGAYAVTSTGGPAIAVPVGRVDATEADPPGRMASEMSSAQVLKDNFAAKGFTVREMVALSGAHTLGGKGFGDPVAFDNAYYTSLLQKPWLNTSDPMSSHIGLPSDHVLPDDPECLPIIQEYARDQAAFHRDFAAAYVKMSLLGAQWA